MTAGLLKAVGSASLSAGVMILAVMVLRLWFQDRTPRKAFCLLWDIVLVRLLILQAVPSPVSVWKWLPKITGGSTAVREPPVTLTVIDGVLVQQEFMAVQSEVGITWLAEDTARAVPGTGFPLALDWGAVLTAVWLAAALLLAFGFLWSHLRSRRVYAASLPLRDPYVLDWLDAHPLRRPVRVRMSDRIDAPLTYGVLYPVILLPRGIGDREVLSCVLAHEQNHIRRFDALRKVFLAAALCLHWFNPLVWAMYALANRDIELACDEAVLQGGADREQYALALLGLEEQRGRWRPSGSHFSGHALEERIKAIMIRKHISLTALVAVLLVMCVTTTVFASAAPESGNTAQSRDKNPPQTGYIYDHLQAVEDIGVSILSKGGEDGEKLYSTDGGKTWMSDERFHAEYGSWGDDWQVEWWTYEDYKVWLEEEKEVLQSIIGERAYTSYDGWFIWDQAKVDETIAIYEGILEKIKNGALYSKTIVDKSGNEVGDVMLGSDVPLDMVVGATYETSDAVAMESNAVDEAALREELKVFGVEGNENLMTYNGQLVRYSKDGVIERDNRYTYIYTKDQDTGQGKTFEEILAQYEQYGLIYHSRNSSMGGMAYNGLPVRVFVDFKPDGGAFSYADPYAEEDGLTVRTVYDENGNIIGLSADSISVQTYNQEKLELGFDFCVPVDGKISSGFGAGANQFHCGVDLAAGKGADIAAFADGVVSETGFNATLGYYVVLAHADGYTTLYAHCGSVSVAEGGSVTMGQKIAEVGASGTATGPVLHFELRSGETYLDPAQYLGLEI